VLDGDSAELAARYPSVVLGLISADCQRLRDKAARGGLSLDEYNRLRAGLGIHRQIVDQSRQPASQPKPRRGVGSIGRRRNARGGEGSKLDEISRELAKDERKRSRENEHGDEAQTGRAVEAVPG
jgi:hypothetical protein